LKSVILSSIFNEVKIKNTLKKLQTVLILVAICSTAVEASTFKNNSFFVGHAYGTHGEYIVPDPSLENFLKKNPPSFLAFGGDLTARNTDFEKFYDHFKGMKTLMVRGNHDGQLFDKIPYWKEAYIDGNKFFNLDMNRDMKFSSEILGTMKDAIILQHYVWFLSLYSGLPIANSMYRTIPINPLTINFGKNNVYLAGDCGAFSKNFPFASTIYKENTFICSGLGTKWANHVVDLNNYQPIFFDHQGNVMASTCKNFYGRYENTIILCLPNSTKAELFWSKIESKRWKTIWYLKWKFNYIDYLKGKIKGYMSKLKLI